MSRGGAAVGSLKSQRKEALETGSGVFSPLFPWLDRNSPMGAPRVVFLKCVPTPPGICLERPTLFFYVFNLKCHSILMR